MFLFAVLQSFRALGLYWCSSQGTLPVPERFFLANAGCWKRALPLLALSVPVEHLSNPHLGCNFDSVSAEHLNSPCSQWRSSQWSMRKYSADELFRWTDFALHVGLLICQPATWHISSCQSILSEAKWQVSEEQSRPVVTSISTAQKWCVDVSYLPWSCPLPWNHLSFKQHYSKDKQYLPMKSQIALANV